MLLRLKPLKALPQITNTFGGQPLSQVVTTA